MGMFGLVLTMVMLAIFVVLLFVWAIPTARRHNDGTDTFMESTGFWSNDYEVEKYHCNRGRCNGSHVWEADRKTHDKYHDRVDNGHPNPYAFNFYTN